mmetsp:Transcript_6748/g.16533  ORF Transcript_6748/g.16533 Transcript_6748/m.16533 type:complete len:316 (-) Transcript_6748:71-1018(-)
MWSPINREKGSQTANVWNVMTTYLKVKSMMCILVGVGCGLVLYGVGVEESATFGMVHFFANYVPNVGAVVATLVPCIVTAFDVRKTLSQVVLSFLGQSTVHGLVGYFIEPIFFGAAVDVHSVIVLLSLGFFGYIWGVSGMLLSVPLVAVMRLLAKSYADMGSNRRSGEAELMRKLQQVLEGKWMEEDEEDEDELMVTTDLGGRFAEQVRDWVRAAGSSSALKAAKEQYRKDAALYQMPFVALFVTFIFEGWGLLSVWCSFWAALVLSLVFLIVTSFLSDEETLVGSQPLSATHQRTTSLPKIPSPSAGDTPWGFG